MLISVFSPKGGVGTTVTSVLFGQAMAQHGPTLLLDACRGDIHEVIGGDEAQYSFDEWVDSPEPTAESLEKIAIASIENLDFVSGQSRVAASDPHETFFQREVSYEKRQVMIDALVQSEFNCVVDIGTQQCALNLEIALASDLVVMVLRECYLGMSRAVKHRLTQHVDVCVVIQESGRSISADQIADTLSLSTLIQLDARRDYARCIDAGVLVYRTPARLINPIESYLADALSESSSQEVSDVFDDVHQRNNQQFWSRNETAPPKLLLNPAYKKHVTTLLKGKK